MHVFPITFWIVPKLHSEADDKLSKVSPPDLAFQRMSYECVRHQFNRTDELLSTGRSACRIPT